jgi:outer membrane protein
MKKLIIALSIALSGGLLTKTYAQEVITIQQAIEKTLNNNLQIRQSQLNENLSDETLKQSKASLFPTVNGNGSYNVNFGRSLDPSTQSFINQQFTSFNGGISSSVDLFQGFTKINQIRQNKLLLAVDQTNTEKVKNDLVLQVITSYMQILYNKDFLVAAKQQLAVANDQLKQQEELLNVGNKTLADLAESKSLVATAELDVTTAENALTISYITLAQLMDVPSATVYDVKAPDVSAFNGAATIYRPEEVYNDALGIFPDIKLAALRTEASKSGIDIARGSLFPRVALGGGLNTQYSNVRPDGFYNQIGQNFGQYVGASLQIPIFNGFTTRTNVRRARIFYAQSQTEEQLAKNNLNKVIYQAVADLKAAKSTYESATKTFTSRSESFSVIEQRYNVGLVNSLDYSTSLTNKNRAEIDMIRSKYDLLFRSKVIDYYLGKQIAF